MVPAGDKGLGDAGVKTLAIMLDPGHFAVHRLRSTDHFAAEHITDDLMSEADSQDRNFFRQMPYRFPADPGIVGRAGTR